MSQLNPIYITTAELPLRLEVSGKRKG